MMLLFIFLGAALALTNAYHQIEDIPIEHFNFEHGDPQYNAMDIELMPRFQKSIHISEAEEDPKEYFFSSYSQYGDSYTDGVPNFEEVSEEDGRKERIKREADESTTLPVEENDRKSIVTTLGKPLELEVIDPENITEKSEDGVIVAVESDETSNFLINDFIRFKRSTETERMAKDVANLKKIMEDIDEKNKSKQNASDENPKSLVEEIQSPHTEKLIMDQMDHRDHDDDIPRDTRGATKEQWVKQLYPVRRREELEDISAAPTEKEIVRAPRVHFVTQGMADSSPGPEYTRYDREARARHLNKEVAWNLARDPYREMEYYQPRYTRNYMPPPSHSNYRNDRYSNYDQREPYEDYPTRSRYRDYAERPYDSNNNNYNTNSNYSGSKGRQRRIIYYATLPDISRTSPNVNLRDRYEYRDRYDNRYFSPESSYQMRKPYTKSRYDESDNRKPQYPLKVSTDVNVREVKKNPEGRVYSEVDRSRFPQSSNYRSERA